jgi:phosphatidylethanolamine-binding protein (PEBP) family uncharacterized protein
VFTDVEFTGPHAGDLLHGATGSAWSWPEITPRGPSIHLATYHRIETGAVDLFTTDRGVAAPVDPPLYRLNIRYEILPEMSDGYSGFVQVHGDLVISLEDDPFEAVYAGYPNDGGGPPRSHVRILHLGAGCTDPRKGHGMRIKSSAFNDGDRIPDRFTGDGEDVSPPLSIADLPAGTRSLALVVDDPDAPSLPEGVPTEEMLEDLGGARQGKNDFDRIGYGGPAPPPGPGQHHYRFTAYALREHVDLETARLTGTYSRD